MFLLYSSPVTIVILTALLPGAILAAQNAKADTKDSLLEATNTNASIPYSATHDYSPAPTYNPNEHLVLVNLFKRGCTLPQGIVCSDGNACCNNPSNSNDGWCCGSGKICGDGQDGAYCGFSTVYTTVTTTVVNTVSDLNTITVSEAGSTKYETITSTKIVTSTVSNVDTATEIITVTVTRAIARRAAATDLPASANVYPTARQQQLPVLAQATPSVTSKAQGLRAFHIRDLLPRDEISTVVSTFFVTEQSTTTASGDTTITDTYTETSTTTKFSTLTFTSAINAKTTVQSTFTLTIDQANTGAANTGAANTGVAGTSTGSARLQQATSGATTGAQDSGNSGGLSTGAKAGIGAGVAGVVIIAGGLFAFMMLARRKKDKGPAASSTTLGAPSGAGYANITNDKAGHNAPEAYTPTPSTYTQDTKYAHAAPLAATASYNHDQQNHSQPYPLQPELDSTAMAPPATTPYRYPSPGHTELDSSNPVSQYSSPGPNVYEMQSQSGNGYQQPAGGFHAELDGQGARR